MTRDEVYSALEQAQREQREVVITTNDEAARGVVVELEAQRVTLTQHDSASTYFIANIQRVAVLERAPGMRREGLRRGRRGGVRRGRKSS